MATAGKTGEVALRLFGRTGHAILGLLYARPDREFYQQEITQAVRFIDAGLPWQFF